MKTIIAGSRGIVDYLEVVSAIKDSGIHISEVVSGAARGVDRLGERYARENEIPIKSFPVTSEDWNSIGRSAGHVRNRKMAHYADALIAIWDGASNGTKGMIEYAKKQGLKVHVHISAKVA